MAVRKSRRVRRNLRKSRRNKNYRGGGWTTTYILNKYRTNTNATPYTIAMAIYLAERNGQHELTQNDWTELQNYDYRIYQALSDMYPK